MAENLDCGGGRRPFDFSGALHDTNNGQRHSYTPPGSPGKSDNGSVTRTKGQHSFNDHTSEQRGNGVIYANNHFDPSGRSYDELSDQVKILTSIVLENKNNNVSLAKRFKAER